MALDDIPTAQFDPEKYLRMMNPPSLGEQYVQQVQQVPRWEDYKPSLGRRILGGLVGLGRGYDAGVGVVREPYERALEQYGRTTGALGSAAQMQMAQQLQKSRLSELGMRALMEASRRKQAEETAETQQYLRSPERFKLQFGYRPQTLEELQGITKLQHPGAGIVPRGISGPTIAIPDPTAPGGYRLEKNPNYVAPYYVGEDEKKRLMDYAAKLRQQKPLSPADEDKLRQQAIANVYAKNPDLQGHITVAGGKMIVTAPKDKWYSGLPIIGEDIPGAQKATAAVEAEYQRLLQEHQQIRNQAIDQASEDEEDYSGYSAEPAE